LAGGGFSKHVIAAALIPLMGEKRPQYDLSKTY